MPIREKRKLSTLLEMLDAKGKTILEAWHTENDGVSFGQQEQNESGNFSSNQPFRQFANRQLNARGSGSIPIGGSNNTNRTWPEVDSISFGDYFDTTTENKPRNLEEMYYSQNIVKFNSGDTTTLRRENLRDKIWKVFGSTAVNNKDYWLRFYRAVGTTLANVPDPDTVKAGGEAGFNVGQVAPFDGEDYIFGDKLQSEFGFSKAESLALKKIEAEQRKLLQMIRPGANRIAITWNIKQNLDERLQANLLMPSDIEHANVSLGVTQQQDLATAIEEGESSNINDDTFTKSYLVNRSIRMRNRNPKGTMGGRPIADLQGPDERSDNYSVFKFEEDAKRATTFTQQRGFIDNVKGNVFVADPDGTENVAGLLPAVQNDKDTNNYTSDKTTLLKTFEKGDSQAFPFMFETVNKGGAGIMGPEYKQYCFLQATLQSLSESYAPSWTSKHFFGRTEQIHTYTMTDRTIDLSFVVFANEIRRLQNLYERITWLAQQTYGSYDDSSRMKAGPLIRMTIGDMFSNLTGFIRSLSFDWSYLGPGGKWEITQGLRIPMACSVQMNFTVIHDNMPDRSYAFYPGPILRDDGLVGNRGKTTLTTRGGPLISTVERRRPFEDAARSFLSALDEGEDVSSANEIATQREAAIAAYAGSRDEMYIDTLKRNMSLGQKQDVTREILNDDGRRTNEVFTDFIF